MSVENSKSPNSLCWSHSLAAALLLSVWVSNPTIAGLEEEEHEAPRITADDYLAAAKLHEFNLYGKVRNERVAPHWLADGARFWYRRDTPEGHEFVVVETTEGSRKQAFNHLSLADTLTRVISPDSPFDAAALPLESVELDKGLKELNARVDGYRVRCMLAVMHCDATKIDDSVSGLLRSPDDLSAAVTRDSNLFIRNLESGQERQLTDDGTEYYGYGKMPDSSLIALPQRRAAIHFPPVGAIWSPDSRYLVAPRLDERSVGRYTFVEWVPLDGSTRPIPYDLKIPIAGDRDLPEADYFVFDMNDEERIDIVLPEGMSAFGDPIVGWDVDEGLLYFLGDTPGMREIALFSIDLDNGERTELFRNRHVDSRTQLNPLLYAAPNVRILAETDEIIWYSEESGHGHLYLYDANTGERKNQITGGDWNVFDIVAVDEKNRRVYIAGGGRENGHDPYYRQLYRVDFDGGNLTLLTDPAYDHYFRGPPTSTMVLLFNMTPPPPLVDPAGEVFVDTYSTVDLVPVSALRSTKDGSLIAILETADATDLFAAGYRPPQRFSAKAADGKTDLYGVIYRPPDLDESRSYPVIDAAYGGPQVIVAPKNFSEAYKNSNPVLRSVMARLGFVVVTVDARGTPYRSRAFWEEGYGDFTELGVDDHVAVIEALGKRYPYLDLLRVGIHGHSWGGTFSTRAILQRPDFYRVAVSSAGVHDYTIVYPGFEPFTGIPEYADGGRFRTKPDEKPKNYEHLMSTLLVDNLEGKLLLMFGDLDENVPPQTTVDLLNALHKAQKPYDLVYFPNKTHAYFSSEAYAMKRTMDYYVEHLMGLEPPPVKLPLIKRPARREL